MKSEPGAEEAVTAREGGEKERNGLHLKADPPDGTYSQEVAPHDGNQTEKSGGDGWGCLITGGREQLKGGEDLE